MAIPNKPPEPRNVGPPRWADRLLEWFVAPHLLEDVHGDLQEVFYKGVAQVGVARARREYGWAVLHYLTPFFYKRKASQYSQPYRLSNPDMLLNYVKIAWRTIIRNKVPAFINMAGLSIGLACCLLILLYTKDEISYDRFHQKKGQLFQLTCHRIGAQGEDKHFAMAAMIQGPAFKREIPEIEAFVRVNRQDFVVRTQHQVFREKGTWVDQNFFSVFSFPLLSGQPEQVLTDPHSVVLSEEMARKYFGTTNAIGKTLDLEMDGRFEPFTISGIAKRAPQNSSIKFTMLLPFRYLEAMHPDNGWMWVSYPTYLLLNAKASLPAVVAKMARVFSQGAKDELAQNKRMGYTDQFVWGIQPFLRMHLNTDFEGTPEASNPIYTYILTGLAFFILLIACINFVNLTVALSLNRGKEIGIRKVMGSQRSQLIQQFFGESLLLCFMAFVVAIVLAQIALPYFNELANKQLQLDYLLDSELVVGFVGLFLLTGFTAGFYPALLIARATPSQTLYSRFTVGSKDYVAKGLVIVQFALATFLMISTGFIYRQFSFLTQTDLGYNDENLLELTVDKAAMNRSLTALMIAELAPVPGTEWVAPHNVGSFGGPTKAGKREFKARYEHVDESYLPTLQVPMLAGRNFSRDFPADSLHSVIINEAFAREAGWKTPVGQTIDGMNFPGWGNRKVTVIGLVKDYHATSLREKIGPQVFTMESKLPFGKFLIRLKQDNIPQTIQALEQAYHRIMPNEPFQYSFKDDLNHQSYEAEAKWKQIITLGALLTIFISCIGLFGMAMLSTRQRLKEIAIRKVLGASLLDVSGGLSRQFLSLVAIGFVLASPVAWYAIHYWLENYAYKIDITWPIFALTALLVSALALLTVGYHVLKAATSNPAYVLQRD
jgi:putative ABC transport system permease protein